MTRPKKTSRRSKRLNFNSDIELERKENGEVSEIELSENNPTDQELTDPQEAFDLGEPSIEYNQKLEKSPLKCRDLEEPKILKVSEIRILISQASHDNYDVIQNEISKNIERLSQRVD